MMRKLTLLNTKASNLLMIVCSCFILLSCNKNDEGTDPTVFDHNYKGSLSVNFLCQMPQFSVEESMKVTIDKFGIITFESGTLQYFGETMFDDKTKITRTGQWQMNPEGILKTDGGVNYLEVNANIFVEEDTQRVYSEGILISEFSFTGAPNSEFAFVFDDALSENGCSPVGVSDQYGSIIWTLMLSIAPD